MIAIAPPLKFYQTDYRPDVFGCQDYYRNESARVSEDGRLEHSKLS